MPSGPISRRAPASWRTPSVAQSVTRRAALLGYSLGARVALHVLTQIGPARHAVPSLIGATGGIEDPEARAGRRRSDDVAGRRARGIG